MSPAPTQRHTLQQTPNHTPQDPTRAEIERVTFQLQIQQQKQTRLLRKLTHLLHNDTPKAEIIDQLETSYATINNTLKLPRTYRVLSLMQQLHELKGGPTADDRRNMAWRIALSAEEKSPTTSLKAIDMLNRQAGEYQTNKDNDSSGLTINVLNFQAPNPQTAIPQHEKEINPNHQHQQFQPVTINTDQTT